MANLLELPWEDIICKRVFIYLPASDICRLQLVSKQFSCLVVTHFELCRKIDLSISGKRSRFSSRNFAFLTNNCQSLRELNLNGCKRWLQDRVLIPVLTRNICLKKIDISGCLGVTNESIKVLALNCKTLEDLILAECRWLTPDALLVVGLECCNLKKLVLTGCWNINDESISTVYLNNKSIFHVDIDSCYGISNDSIAVMATHCIDLQYLSIQGCWRIDNDAVCKVREYCKQLHTLKVKECRNVDERSLTLLRSRGVQIDVPKPPEYHRPYVPMGYNNLMPNNEPFMNLQV